MRYMITEEMMNSYQKHLVRGEYAQDTIKKYLRDVGAFMTWLDGFTAGRTEEAASDVNTGLSISLDSGVTAQGSCHASDAEEAAPESEVGEGGSWARSAMVDKEGTTGWKAHLTEKGYAPATVNAMLSSLNSFLGYLGWDDCKVKFLKIQRRTFRDQEKELNRAEYGRLLEAAKESGNTRLALLLETVCATGIRVSEVRYVTVETGGHFPEGEGADDPAARKALPEAYGLCQKERDRIRGGVRDQKRAGDVQTADLAGDERALQAGGGESLQGISP